VGIAVLLALAVALSRPATTPPEAPPAAAPATEAGPAPEASQPQEPEPSLVPAAATEPDPATVFEPEDFPELPPVDLEEEADYGNGVTVTVDEVTRTHGEGKGVGEVAGPSVLVELTLRNGSRDTVDLGAVVVDLYSADGRLGTPLFGDARTKPFEGLVEPGRAARASYVIRLPEGATEIKVTVSYEAETPAATFTGDV